MTIAVLIHERLDAIEEIELNVDEEIHKVIPGRATFIGQWPELDVVIVKAVVGQTLNQNQLPRPFHEEITMGKILLVRMDEDSEPRDFTKEEYLAWVERRRSP